MKKLNLFITAALICGCGNHNAGPIGVYFGHYGGVDECVEIRADHSFQQVLVKGGKLIYNSTGDWTLGPSVGFIKLKNFYVAVDLTRAQQIRTPDLLPLSPEKYSVVVFSHGSSSGVHWITSAPDTLYILTTDNKSTILSAAQFASENQAGKGAAR